MSTHYLIIGNGIAGVSAAEEIRRHSPRSLITLISDEPHPMYSRPGLAYVLTGEIPQSSIFCRTQEFYADLRLDLVYGRVRALDPSSHLVQLDNGNSLSYDHLLLATGAKAVPAPFPGKELDGVIYLDTLKNVQDVLGRIRNGVESAVVVGGGMTAIELAEGLARQGVVVHYLLRKRGIWSALLTQSESRIIESHVLEHGIQLGFDQEIAEIVGAGGRVGGVRTTRGEHILCQLVGAAIGVRPNLTLASGTGIRTDRGIVVNEYLQSSAPGIFAAGDVAQVFDPWTGETRMDLLWHSAQAMGRIAGANMTGARQQYIPSIPFNAARVFGVHLTSIGRSGVDDKRGGTLTLEKQYYSRGSSEGWWANGSFVAAEIATRQDSVRLMLSENRIAGALLLGDQSLAGPLKYLIAARADISPIRTQLECSGPELGNIVQSFYARWQHASQGAAQ